MHSDVAVVVFAFVFIGAPIGTGEWLRRRTNAPGTASRALVWHNGADGLVPALMAVLRAARDVIAICPRCHLDEDTSCVCPGRRQRLAGAVTAAEEALRGQGDDRAGTASVFGPKIRR